MMRSRRAGFRRAHSESQGGGQADQLGRAKAERTLHKQRKLLERKLQTSTASGRAAAAEAEGSVEQLGSLEVDSGRPMPRQTSCLA